MEPGNVSGDPLQKAYGVHATATPSFGPIIVQIIAIDFVFSVRSICKAVGMTDKIPIMVAAVIITVGIMLFPDGFSFHVPEDYIYAAMNFSMGVENLHIILRDRHKSLVAASQ
jgi:predicted tellurium resistance membrane protein TerC